MNLLQYIFFGPKVFPTFVLVHVEPLPVAFEPVAPTHAPNALLC